MNLAPPEPSPYLIRCAAAFALFLCGVTSAHAEGKSWKALNTEVISLYHQGRIEETIPLAEEAVEVAQAVYTPEHPYVVASFNNLAALCFSQGKYAQAEELYNRALAIDVKLFGPDHPGVAVDKQNLERLHQAQQKFHKEPSPNGSVPRLKPPSFQPRQDSPVAAAQERKKFLRGLTPNFLWRTAIDRTS